jgi:hypothetical protein
MLLAVGAGGGYWYLSRQVEAVPVPAEVLAAEDALSLSEAVGLAHLDVRHAVEVERKFLGDEDREALLAPMADSDAILGVLLRGGIDLRQSVEHVLGALVLGEDGPGAVGIAIGSFEVARVKGLLGEIFQVAEVTLAGLPVLMLTNEDLNTCQVSEPVAVHISDRRIVMGDPRFVEPVLERLGAGAAPALGLDAWRAYREGKVFSLALLGSLQDLAEQTPHPVAQMTAKSAAENLSMVEQVYAGVSFQALPARLVFDARIDSRDAGWAGETAGDYAAWAADLDATVRGDLPALAQLTEYLSVEAEESRLVMRAALGEDFLNDAARVPAELLGLMFAGLGAQGGEVAAGAAPEEQVLPPDEVASYRESLAHSELAPFDPEAEQGFEVGRQSGPFAFRIDAFRLAEGEDEVVEVALEALSGELHNMNVESMHQVSGSARAQLFITRVLDGAGGDLLREERCGAERNALPGELRPTTRYRYIDNTSVQIPVVTGKKSVRMKPGTGVDDIETIVGYVALRLPTGTETFRVDAPFEEQVVEVPGVRIKLSGSEAGTVKYEISGEVDRVLATRALNAAGQYLRPAGAYASGRFLGAGKSVGKSFAGEPASVEFVIATQEASQRYVFEITDVAPRFDRWDRPEPYTVTASTEAAFRQDVAGTDLSAACAERPADAQLDPFQLCPASLAAQWGGLQGQFQVLGPNLPSLMGNLSGLELRVDSLSVEGEEARVPVELGTFLKLRTVYGEDHVEDTPWISAQAPEVLEGKTIAALQGRLVARVPVALAKVALDVTDLGHRVTHENGLDVRLVGFWNGTLQLDVAGPRERIVQFIPRDADGTALATNNARLDETDDPSRWRASLSVSGRPATLDIVFAETQETLEFPFDMALGGE